MITSEINGVAETVAHLEALGPASIERLRIGIARATTKLQRKVVTEKLAGQVLGVRTGRGRRSIHMDVQASGDRVVGVVSTNLFYMVGWETGWDGAGASKQLSAAKSKFKPKGGVGGGLRKRSFLVPSLMEMEASGEIRAEITAALAGVAS